MGGVCTTCEEINTDTSDLPKVIEETVAIKRSIESLAVYSGNVEAWHELEAHEYWGAQVQPMLKFVHKQTNVAVYQEKDSGVWQIIIMGTYNPRNVLSDIRFLPKDVEGLNFHTGFANIAEATFEFIKNNLPERSECRVTGHSLGAAVATILAWKLHKNGFKLRKVVTFGQPEVTNTEGAETLSKELDIHRFVVHKDPVAGINVPGLVHAGVEIELSHKDQTDSEILPFSDHSMITYVESLLEASSLSEELKQSLKKLAEKWY